MPVIKTEEFRRREVKLARVAKAFAHPARVMILRELTKRNECVCGEIVDIVPLAQATVSQHLRELKEIGLIRGEIDGPRSCYCINPKTVLELTEFFEEFLAELKTACVEKAC